MKMANWVKQQFFLKNLLVGIVWDWQSESVAKRNTINTLAATLNFPSLRTRYLHVKFIGPYKYLIRCPCYLVFQFLLGKSEFVNLKANIIECARAKRVM